MNTDDDLPHALARAYPEEPDQLQRLRERLAVDAQREGILDVAYRSVDSPVGPLLLAATGLGLVRVAYACENHDTVLQTLSERISPRILNAPRRLDATVRELDEYFAGRRQYFDLPLDWQLAGGFRRTVLTQLPSIAYGHTASYGALARLAGSPNAVRAVGTACGTNPLPVVVPCHRVIRANGTMGGYLGGIEAKRTLLALETRRLSSSGRPQTGHRSWGTIGWPGGNLGAGTVGCPADADRAIVPCLDRRRRSRQAGDDVADPTGDAPGVVRERTRRSRFLALPGAAVLPELPTPSQAVRQLAALADPAPLRQWVRGHREPDGVVPPMRHSPSVAAKFLFDEWALQVETARSRMRIPTTDFRRRLRDELNRALDLFQAKGWIDQPRTYHQDPPALHDEDVEVSSVGWGRFGFEHLRWASGWAPWPEEPGYERWLDYRRNLTAHAWVLRHADGPRPWILCINGYRTGEPLIDLASFRAEHLHRRLGLNVAILVQPLHGPRSAGGTSGDRVLFGGAMNLVHATAQAAWDARRLLSWIRGAERAPLVGVQGLSLGGFVTALVACLDGDLACAIAGIPESDLLRGLRRSVEPLLPPFYEQWGLSWTPTERVTRASSPLAMEVLIPRERRFIFAGVADRWVRPGNIVSLWEHWDRPAICWYQGSHLSSFTEPAVRNFVDAALLDTLGAHRPS